VRPAAPAQDRILPDHVVPHSGVLDRTIGTADAHQAVGAAVDDALGDRARRMVLATLAVALVATMVVAVGLGPVFIQPMTVLRIVGHHIVDAPSTVDWSASDDAIIWQVRLPRVLLGAVVGAALGITGLALQAMVRNPLAEPYILGVSAGASTGAAAAILFGVGVSLGGQATTLVAFLGALAAMAMVLTLARVGGAITPGRMLVAGIAVGYLLHATTSLLILFADSAEGARAVMFWLLGSLAAAEWSALPGVTLVVTISLGLLWWWRRRLDLLTLGDESARAMGIDPDRTRFVLIGITALCVAAAVATSGGIGFVGLAVPHIARRFAGVAHRASLPAAALIGALLLVWADVAARLVLQPRELPIGVVTGVLGAPILVLLVRRLQLADA
jgi:iron complex transport system permease protein